MQNRRSAESHAAALSEQSTILVGKSPATSTLGNAREHN